MPRNPLYFTKVYHREIAAESDLAGMSLASKGLWWTILLRMWNEGSTGIIVETASTLAETNHCTLIELQACLTEIARRGVGEIAVSNDRADTVLIAPEKGKPGRPRRKPVTISRRITDELMTLIPSSNVTVINRRLYRVYNTLENHALRQQKYVDKVRNRTPDDGLFPTPDDGGEVRSKRIRTPTVPSSGDAETSEGNQPQNSAPPEPAAEQPARPSYPLGFSEFWKTYPTRGRQRSSRAQSYAEWQRQGLESTSGQVIAVLDAYVDSDDWQREASMYVPAAHRWLRNRKWAERPAGSNGNGEHA